MLVDDIKKVFAQRRNEREHVAYKVVELLAKLEHLPPIEWIDEERQEDHYYNNDDK